MSTPAAPPAEPDAATLDRLLTDVDDAGYWTEHLVLCADLVVGPAVEKHMAGMQDGQCAQFLLEEAKVASVKLRRAIEVLSAHLKAGNERPGGPLT
jgi:hypothetical protein